MRRAWKNIINRPAIKGTKGSQLHISHFLARLLILVLGAFSAYSLITFANPTGGQVTSGSATISNPTTTITNINQTSQQAIINWQTFNIGQHEATHFLQPTGGIALNRINAAQGASSIYGQLTATGQIILVNPAGIFFGPAAYVNVGGIIATTATISDQNFLNGNYQFSAGSPSYTGTVINQGTIIATNYGLVALLGNNVQNNGLIQANLGHVILGSGGSFTITFGGNDLISFSVDSKSLKAGGITNTGTLRANGGQIQVTANAASGLLDNAIDMQGVAQAQSVGIKNGEIILSSNSGINVASNLDVSSKHASGGTIKVLGSHIHLAPTAILNANGAKGGGEILIGGNRQGLGPEPNALSTSIDAGARIEANALQSGNGGEIIVWSNGITNFAGKISAMGGIVGGNGGFTEVSGHQLLNFKGNIDLSATKGLTGTLLLDPENLTIQTAGSTTATNSGNNYTSNVDNSILTVSDLQAALANANVLVQTGTGGVQAGDITVANNVTWNNPTSLTLNAYRNININALITNSLGGSLILKADNTGNGTGTITFSGITPQIALSGGGVVNFYYNPASFPTPTDFSSHVNTSGGTSFTPYMLVNNLTNLQNINNNLSGNYALGTNIDASATSGWNAGAGFVPIGTSAANFTGQFNGQNNTIDSLTIALPLANDVGLFGYVNTLGAIQNLNLTNANITGLNNVGALIGSNAAGSVNNIQSTGSVTSGASSSNVGGLIGLNAGNVMNSSSTATVLSGATSNDIGGLIGQSSGSIINSNHATGSVTAGAASNDVGGLVGYTTGDVTQSYNTGPAIIGATGSTNFGGLIGYSGGHVSNSYSTGAVTAGAAVTNVGGLIGYAFGPVDTSYSTGPIVTGATGSANIGGLVGFAANNITNSYSHSSILGGAANSNVGGLVGQNNGIISNTYSTGNVAAGAGSAALGGLVGLNNNTVNNSFWDNQTSGQLSSSGGTGESTTNMMQQTTFCPSGNCAGDLSHFDFANNWGIINGVTYPYLQASTASVSGKVYTDIGAATPVANDTVSLVSNGTILSGLAISQSQATSDITGYYYYLLNRSYFSQLNPLLAYISAGTTVGNTLFTPTITPVTANIYGNTIYNQGLSSLSNSLLASTKGSLVDTGILYSANGNNLLLTNSTNTTANFVTALNTPYIINGNITPNTGGANNFTFDGPVTVSGNNIVLAGQTFTNNSPSFSLNPGGGTFLVWSGNPANDNRGGITYDFKQYNATYGVTSVLGSGTGFLYTLAPVITPTLTGSVSKVYDANTNATLSSNNYLSSGAVDNDTVTLNNPSLGTYDNANVGNNKNVAVTGLSIASATNGSAVVYGYQLSSTSANANIGSITPATLAYTANSGTMTYGGVVPSLSGTITGFVGAENQANATTGTLAFNTPATSTSNVGNYAINGSGLTANNGNYVFTQALGNANALTINPATLTYNANTDSMTYGGSVPALSGTVTGYVNNQNQANATTGTLAFNTPATSTSNVGNYAINGSGLTANNGNYVFTQALGNANALTINPATLTYNANTDSMTYGGNVPALSGTVTGYVNNQNQANATTGTLAFNTPATSTSNVGNYAINGSGLTANNGNYVFTQALGNANALTINPATLTYNANTDSMTYGGSVPGLSGTVTGYVNNQNQASATTGTLAFNTPATSTSNVGNYAINGSGLTANNGNYVFTQALGNANALTINPATLTYNANTDSMTYGGSVPALSGTVTGYVNNQNQANATTGTLAFNTPATSTSNVGNYAINGSGLTANNGNYVFTQALGNANALTINPATLTYNANTDSMTYGGSVPGLSGTVTGYVNNQNQASATTGTLAFNTPATSTSNVGNYAINGSGLTANNGNYVFTQALGNANAFSITGVDPPIPAPNTPAVTPILSETVSLSTVPNILSMGEGNYLLDYSKDFLDSSLINNINVLLNSGQGNDISLICKEKKNLNIMNKKDFALSLYIANLAKMKNKCVEIAINPK